MGSRLFIATALLALAISLLSACAQNPSAEGVDASAARADTQGPPHDDVILDKDEYAVTKDGNLIIGGDVQVRCKDIMAVSIQVPSGNREIRKQLEQDQREQAELCTKAGFPPDKNPQSP
jgi:hypothetical protein